MSFSCFPIPNSVNSDDDDFTPPPSPTTIPTGTPDFSGILSRQFQNVASFLAPPPPQRFTNFSGDVSGNVSPSSYEGVKNDLAEISDTFKTGLALFSPKKAVNEISKFASNLLQSDKEGEGYDHLGITDAVLEFVREISVHPECWIDFPFSLRNRDFSMSQAHQDHVATMERLVPNLASLRETVQMSENEFWMIYFVMLLSRLNEDGYKLLSTPEIVQVREVVLQKLRNKNNTPASDKGSIVISTKESENPSHKPNVSSSETGNATNRMKNEIRDDEEGSSSSASETSDWVRVTETAEANRGVYHERRSESEESSDWHAVDEVNATANRSMDREGHLESGELSEWHAVDDGDL